MISRTCLSWILAGCLPSAVLAQGTPRAESIPPDPLELAASRVAGAPSAVNRPDALELLRRAHTNLALRGGTRGYDLKVSFTVNSGGQTAQDGDWQMEDMFDPGVGSRWTAMGPGGYRITRIRTKDGMLYGDETAAYVPLRLQEARATLFDPLPSADGLDRASVRTTTASYNGMELTCLLTGPRADARAGGGRLWNEAEHCIDPQSGLLATASQVPGRYFAYDYSDARRFDGHVLPSKVVVSEGGKSVTTISVDSVSALDSPDPNLFVPTEAMKAKGRPIVLGGAHKITRAAAPGTPPAGSAPDAVCVFGVMTPEGQLMEAHSLQPSDPNSAAAVEAARQTVYQRPPLGVEPQQYFLFIVERFGVSK